MNTTYLRALFNPAVAALLSLLFIFSSCREEEDPLPAVAKVKNDITHEANHYINSWIYKNMEYWYLWNDKLPTSTDQNKDPESYFKSLIYTEDRFSWIQNNYRELLNSLQGISKEAGYEYVLYREKDNSENVILQVLYIKPGSPAAKSELKRGDIVTHINGQVITVSNYRDLLSAIRSEHTVQYKPLIVGEEKFGAVETATLSAVEFAENPNYLHKVIDTGGKKIGYFVYNFFATGTDSEPGKYDAETDAVFADFKNEGITDLVIDLRYNSGGSESSAKNLASLIGRNIDKSKIFLKRQYNEKVQESILNDESLGENYLISRYLAEANNIGNQLNSGRVYILTSSRTASASELIINALKPFMEVFLIGETTQGKNVGSISLFEEKDTKNTWGIQPIVVKVYNSLGQSDYSQGFAPDVQHKDNSLFLYPLGDTREALLAQAIGQITGASTTAKEDVGAPTRKKLAHSLDFKRRSFKLIMDENIVEPLKALN